MFLTNFNARGVVQHLNVYVTALLIGAFCTSGSIVIARLIGWSDVISNLEIFAVFTSYVCTYLCVKQDRWNYPIGAVSVIAYAALFWQQGLIASAALNVYLAPVLAYGWIRWGRNEVTRPVTFLSYNLKTISMYGGWTLLIYAICIGIVAALGGTMAPFDVMILVGSILAQLLLDNKKIETWVIWALVNVVAIYTYYNSGLVLAAAQYVFFLGNTLYGWHSWWKTYSADNHVKITFSGDWK